MSNDFNVVDLRPTTEEPAEVQKLSTIVVGGCAAGLIIPIAADATFFELSRPTHLKPLESALQKHPEAARETDVYEFHVTEMCDSNGTAHLFGIAVVKHKQLSDAFSELCAHYNWAIARQYLDAGMIERPPSSEKPA